MEALIGFKLVSVDFAMIAAVRNTHLLAVKDLVVDPSETIARLFAAFVDIKNSKSMDRTESIHDSPRDSDPRSNTVPVDQQQVAVVLFY
jgi:hypothetical protein